MPASPLITVMTGAARKAARAISRDFGEVENLQVSQKGPADFVTRADRKAEKVIVEELKSTAKVGVSAGRRRRDRRHRWPACLGG